MFESSDYEQGWNGRFQGVLQPNEVYCWKMVYTVFINRAAESVEKTVAGPTGQMMLKNKNRNAMKHS